MKCPCALGFSAVTLWLASVASLAAEEANPKWITYTGERGSGVGKHVLLIAGDEEYRSEEACPALAKILAVRHGFTCTVLFSLDPQTGEIDPNNQQNIPGLEKLKDADLMIIATRFRNLPAEDMRHIDDYLKAGKPVIGLRTATHAFNIKDKNHPFAHYDWRSKEWPGGFGQQALGETWVAHHGHHKFESTRGVIADRAKDHPIVRGCEDIWGPSDVYTVKNLTDDATVLVYGQVLTGMKPADEPLDGPKNDPMMPVAWIKPYQLPGGKEGTAFCTTMGAAIDLKSEGLRRLIVNAAYYLTGLDDQIPQRADVVPVGQFDPSFYGFGGFQEGMKPSDFALGE